MYTKSNIRSTPKPSEIKKLLVDQDILCYRAAAVAWDQPENAIALTQETLTSIKQEFGISDVMLFLSGNKNFRKTIYPEYKLNRQKLERPPCLEEVKQYFIDNLLAEPIVEHLEADDLLGLNQTEDSCIVSIDKDLDLIPGWHYNHVKQVLYYVNEWEAIYNFYYQLLVGDPADNIKGAKGIGKAKAVKILDDCDTEEELFNAVYPYFTCYDELDMTAKVLWIQRKDRENWDDTGIGKEQRQNLAENCEGSDTEDIPWS